MANRNNKLAGIADPYWYEWSVGLLYALDMLDPDRNIKSVVLQASQLQGLDDVVINFNDNKSECIQIKHTRENDSLTFSDLIRKEKGVSYLSQFCSDWLKSISSGYHNSKAVLFTNRKIGQQKYTVNQGKEEDYERPPLDDFWSYIKEQISEPVKLNEIEIDERWETAWTEFLTELSPLENDEQKLDFLRNFEIKTNQEDLDEIIDSIGIKLSTYFKVDLPSAVQLHKSLCFALMKWTTTLRNREEILLEDLLEALALNSDNFKGIHDIATSEPFFSSRISFVEDIEEYLKTRISPIVFLSGEPGSGKTNIVSHLTNKLDSVITLRFYAFKPLSADDLYISADKGVSDPKALWGDLLIQLRGLLKGKLAKYQVPVSNQLLNSIDQLRSEVIRLSMALSNELGTKTVIAIDGIDHAARSGESNNFLETLVPPEGVPDELCFLIVGQPLNEYKSYPDWFSSDLVTKLEVPKLNRGDILQLYNQEDIAIPKEQTGFAVDIIQEKAKGNTLSTIFAIYEAKKCKTIEELELYLDEKQISSGISSYYQYIWKGALENLPEKFFHVDYVLAGVLSLVNKKVTPEMVSDIYHDPEISKSMWKRILQKLYPVVFEEGNEFRVYHNDFRVYLEKFLKRNISNFIEVAGSIADFYLHKSENKISKHEQVFTLLKYAKREAEYINIFNKEYVIEAISLGRPIEELLEQLEMTLISSVKLPHFKDYINFSCGVATLFQFTQSLDWTNRKYESVIDIPLVLQSEKKVFHRSLLTIEELLRVFREVDLLIDNNQINRAKNIMQRWLQRLTPLQLVDILVENEELDLEELEKQEDKVLIDVLEQWGSICQYTDINFRVEIQLDKLLDYQKGVLAHFSNGWLREGANFKEVEGVKRTLNGLAIYFNEDIEAFIVSLMNSDDITLVLDTMKNIEYQECSGYFKLKLVIWAITKGEQDKYRDLINSIIEAEFDYFPSNQVTIKEDFLYFTFISFVLSYSNYSEDEVTSLFWDWKKKNGFLQEDRIDWAVHSFLSVSINLGSVYKKLHENKDVGIDLNEFEKCICILFDERDLHGRYQINGYKIEQFFLNEYINVTRFLDDSFLDTLLKLFIVRINKYNSLRHLDIYWEFIKQNNNFDVLEGLYSHWMSENGLVWQQEIAEMTEIASNFIQKAIELGWVGRAEEGKKILQLKSIGYTGRKEYSLYNPLQWYENVDNWSSEYWSTLGVNLLNISKNATELGDNRAGLYIDSLIATSAGKQGPEWLWTFAELNEEWDEYWVNRIFDGVINILESRDFTEEELLSLWKVANRIFYVYETDNSYDRKLLLNTIYITDIKEAILETSRRMGYLEIGSELKKIAEYAFSLNREERQASSYIIPNRWFDPNSSDNIYLTDFLAKIASMTSEEVINYLHEEYEGNRNSFRWEYVNRVIEIIEIEQSKDINKYIPSLMDLLLKREEGYYLEYDGSNRVYETIFPYLEEDQIQMLLEKIVNGYLNLDNKSIGSKLYYIKSDIEHFTYCYYKNLPEIESVFALEKIIDMHVLWLTGNGSIPLKNHYVLNKEKSKYELPNNWNEFFANLEEKYFRL